MSADDRPHGMYRNKHIGGIAFSSSNGQKLPPNEQQQQQKAIRVPIGRILPPRPIPPYVLRN